MSDTRGCRRQHHRSTRLAYCAPCRSSDTPARGAFSSCRHRAVAHNNPPAVHFRMPLLRRTSGACHDHPNLGGAEPILGLRSVELGLRAHRAQVVQLADDVLQHTAETRDLHERRKGGHAAVRIIVAAAVTRIQDMCWIWSDQPTWRLSAHTVGGAGSAHVVRFR